MVNNYTLIAYRPSTRDRCGDHYSSNLEVCNSPDIAKIEDLLVGCLYDQIIYSDYAEYEFKFLINGEDTELLEDGYKQWQALQSQAWERVHARIEAERVQRLAQELEQRRERQRILDAKEAERKALQ
jgi:hypothetical protein